LRLHGKNGHANAPQCYVLRTLPILSSIVSLRIGLRLNYV